MSLKSSAARYMADHVHELAQSPASVPSDVDFPLQHLGTSRPWTAVDIFSAVPGLCTTFVRVRARISICRSVQHVDEDDVRPQRAEPLQC